MTSKKFKHIYLHVGHDKTGSSAIQDFFTLNRDELESLGVYFPTGESHPLLGSIFNEAPSDYVYNKAHDRTDREIIAEHDHRCLANLQEQLNTTNAPVVLLSYEGLCTLDEQSHKNISAYFATLAERVSVIYFCRPPLSYALSAASERVKGGGFAWSPLPIVPFASHLAGLVSAYGHENVIVRKYAPSEIGNVLSVVLAILSLPDLGISIDDHLGRNTSLSQDAMDLGTRMIAILNGRLHWKIFNEEITPFLSNMQGRPSKLARATAEQILLESQVHVDYVRREFGTELTEDLERYCSNGDLSEAEERLLGITAAALLNTLVPVFDLQHRLGAGISLEIPTQPLEKRVISIGELLKFSVPFSLASRIEKLEVGVHVLNSKKEFVFGTNSLLLESNFLNIQGDCVANYYLMMNLPVGNYWIGIAFADISPVGRREMAWFDALFMLNVMASPTTYSVGLAPLIAGISLDTSIAYG